MCITSPVGVKGALTVQLVCFQREKERNRSFLSGLCFGLS